MNYFYKRKENLAEPHKLNEHISQSERPGEFPLDFPYRIDNTLYELP